MTDIFIEMTQGDPFYYEVGFVDASGSPVDLTSWAVAVDFKSSLTDTTPLASLSIGSGITLLNDTGAISIQFAASVLDDLCVSSTPRNGEVIPSRVIYGDIKLTPPSGLELVQGQGARTIIMVKVYLGVTA